MNEESFRQEPANLGEKEEKKAERKGYGQLSQSRSTIFTTVIILFIIDLLSIVFAVLPDTSSNTRIFPTSYQIIVSIIIDVFLGINLLRGKKWARTWILIRSIAGIVIWGAIYALQRDFGSVLLNTGVLLALILLLTGASNRLRLSGSIALAVAAAVGGIILSIIGTSMNIPTVSETSSTPESFSTYSSEGFFSIRYPSDWSPAMSIIAEAEAGMKQYLQDIGMGSEASDVQLVFLGSKTIEDNNFAFVSVSLEPNKFWPLETLVESNHQWSLQNIDQYVEHSRVKTTIDGRKAVIQTYQGIDADSILTGYTVAYVSGDKFLWTVVCGSDVEDFESNRITFDQIARSLHVEY